MTSIIYSRNIFILLIMAAAFALAAFTPSKAYAQESVTELELNCNASGKARTSAAGRVFGEIGLGLLGGIVGAGLSIVPMAVGFDMGSLVISGLVFELITPPLVAGGTLLGGWATGGRGKAWTPFVGAYVGAVPCYALLFAGDTGVIISLIATPILSLVGAIVGYEISEKKQTNRLEEQLMQTEAPIMINLFSGTF